MDALLMEKMSVIREGGRDTRGPLQHQNISAFDAFLGAPGTGPMYNQWCPFANPIWHLPIAVAVERSQSVASKKQTRRRF